MTSLLFWDLRRDATRSALANQTFGVLDERTAEEVRRRCDAAGDFSGHCHDIAEVRRLVDGLDVDETAKDDLRSVYGILARAEAAAHGVDVDQTHFHEVGNGSAVKNALLICLAVRATGATEVEATPVQCGEGFVECAHGTLLLPAPATAAVIRMGMPVCPERLAGERLTPTSAALIKHFVTRWVP